MRQAAGAPHLRAHTHTHTAENKKDVDTIHEFLLVKGVEAVAVHGSKDQEEREWAIQSFKAGALAVCVCSAAAPAAAATAASRSSSCVCVMSCYPA